MSTHQREEPWGDGREQVRDTAGLDHSRRYQVVADDDREDWDRGLNMAAVAAVVVMIARSGDG